MTTVRSTRVLGCILCRQPRMSNGVMVSAPLEAYKPVCDHCLDAIGREWRDARTGGAETWWLVLAKDGRRVAETTSKGYAREVAKKWRGGKVKRVSRYFSKARP